MSGVLRVALDMPLRRLFDYLPPDEAGGAATGIAPGVRVRVPFGRQRLIGVVMESADASDLPEDKLKRVLEVLDTKPILDDAALGILRWAADYYHHPIGEALAAALPKALRMGAKAISVREHWNATAEGVEAFARGEPKRAPKQRKLLELLIEHPALTPDELTSHFTGWRDAARALSERLWITSRETPESYANEHLKVQRESATREEAGTGDRSLLVEDGTPVPRELQAPADYARANGPILSEEQRVAVDTVSDALDRFSTYVLHGVTGSGKTEVYLRLVDRVLQQGRRALVLVPEIGLTPQLVGRFRDRFDVPMVVLHSALTDTERLDSWRDAYSGRARIVLGTRSAVFAPVTDLGIIIIDEEHDASFKQHEGGFRYSARDLAVVRAQRASVPIILGSATPALETLHNIWRKRYTRLSLPRRAAAQSVPPKMSLIDLRVHAVRSAISTPAAQAIERHLKEDGQVLVFLNRRGYAPTLLCTACGWIAPCRDCDARMTVHQGARRLRCHHCGADAPLPERCPTCGFVVKSLGQGTERVEETLGTLFPEVPLVRLDRDVVRKRGDMETAMQRMASGEGRILVGTQMVTKGHDFPNVTLVVVLNADQGLFSTDFRASERLAQMIVQVAGRAGRGSKPGEVLIQTEYPDHPLLQSLLHDGYEGFAHTALAEREEAAWPPFSRLAAVRDSAEDAEAALTFLSEARKAAGVLAHVRLLGPVPAAMAKRAGRYHAQLLIESPDRGALHHFLESWLPEIEQLPSARRVRWALDVDPIELF